MHTQHVMHAHMHQTHTPGACIIFERTSTTNVKGIRLAVRGKPDVKSAAEGHGGMAKRDTHCAADTPAREENCEGTYPRRIGYRPVIERSFGHRERYARVVQNALGNNPNCCLKTRIGGNTQLRILLSRPLVPLGACDP